MTVILTNNEKVTASKDMLCYLSIVFHRASDDYINKGCYKLAEISKNDAQIIHQALEEKNYYK